MNARLREVYGRSESDRQTADYPDGSPPPMKAKADDEPLPLPRWLLGIYFVFPIVLYVPDAIFNWFVYSDGVTVPQTDNTLLAILQTLLWAFLSVGIVGMAYLLSMLAPWHWMHRHRLQAIFCGLGVVIATAVTIWNSLAYRSQAFHAFATDQWVYGIWPQLQANQISLTMIFAAVAPPFWGLFWAMVQPTARKRDLAGLQENHAERLMRLSHEAELKTLRAEANAKIRAAQLRGMASTASAAREQMGAVAQQWRGGKKGDEPTGQSGAPAAVVAVAPAPRSVTLSQQDVVRGGLSPMITVTPPPNRRKAEGTKRPEPAPRLTHDTSPTAKGERGSFDHVEVPGADLSVRSVQRG